MWDKVVSFFVSQGILGIIILCLGAVIVLIYKEAKKERREYIEKFINIATESIKFIQESSMTLKDLRDDIKQHNLEAQESRRMNESGLEKVLVMLDMELKNRGRG
jgi:hypothetical protein